ncbi:conserved hypothetical protein [Candida tropicalis MYA-3404]|uniref:4'-phosphopantetheinyl transferase domain-containing protein n=1 Tax=Candida tropicalis (strain ATCC MYA-3404 / T1) TaxID=294747 RepID=C5MBH0_CANTT|nr:conserved hypothetical protein [Candida tropicalis MYA-3404]EER32987.1 conserved hypothetical protein [Candida tropicalis MYA-3404]KAG4406815.1 hypothetical protein JTP64_004199 [Candida tropicalis]
MFKVGYGGKESTILKKDHNSILFLCFCKFFARSKIGDYSHPKLVKKNFFWTKKITLYSIDIALSYHVKPMKKLGITLGLGVDIINSSRFQRLLTSKTTSFSQRLSKRILHPKHELPRFESMTNSRQVQFLTGSWAAKEAVFKTLDIEDQKKFSFNQWYRYHDPNGKPFIWNDNYGLRDEEFHLSISHDDSLIIATVLRQRVIDLS